MNQDEYEIVKRELDNVAKSNQKLSRINYDSDNQVHQLLLLASAQNILSCSIYLRDNALGLEEASWSLDEGQHEKLIQLTDELQELLYKALK